MHGATIKIIAINVALVLTAATNELLHLRM